MKDFLTVFLQFSFPMETLVCTTVLLTVNLSNVGLERVQHTFLMHTPLRSLTGRIMLLHRLRN